MKLNLRLQCISNFDRGVVRSTKKVHYDPVDSQYPLEVLKLKCFHSSLLNIQYGACMEISNIASRAPMKYDWHMKH